MKKLNSACILVGLIACASSRAQEPLPAAELVPAAPLQRNISNLLKVLNKLGSPLPPETTKTLLKLAKNSPPNRATSDSIQQMLDPHCLIGVNINPESRVKAARGQDSAHLKTGEWAVKIIKVHNEAGVTQGIRILGDDLISPDGANDLVGWLDVDLYKNPPMRPRLGGHLLEYIIVKIRSSSSGKREARLTFDVGQGTQDLGFRAEVPVLFTVR